MPDRTPAAVRLRPVPARRKRCRRSVLTPDTVEMRQPAKAAVKTAVKPVTKKVTKEAPQIVNKTEEKIPVKKDLTEKK